MKQSIKVQATVPDILRTLYVPIAAELEKVENILHDELRSDHPFVDQEKRLEPVDMQYGEQTTDQVTYRISPGLTVEGAPQDATVAWKDHAILVTKSSSAPGQITIGRTLARFFTVAKSDEYQDLRGFYQKVAASDQQQLVLTASSAAKGN